MDSSLMIISKAMEFTHGQMEGNIWVAGIRASNMVLAFILVVKVRRKSMDFGNSVDESSGLVKMSWN